MFEGIGTIEVAVEDHQRHHVEQFNNYSYIGRETICCLNLDTQEHIKVLVYVYRVPVIHTVMRGHEIVGGYWMRLKEPSIWKRVD